MRFGRAKNKNDPFRGLFKRLQQGIKCFRCDLVGFIDDENFVAVASGTIPHVFPQLAHLIDSTIRRRVDLDNIDAVSRRDFLAARTFSAGVGGRAFDAIQTAGDDSRDSGFSGTALTGKDIPVSDAMRA